MKFLSDSRLSFPFGFCTRRRPPIGSQLTDIGRQVLPPFAVVPLLPHAHIQHRLEQRQPSHLHVLRQHALEPLATGGEHGECGGDGNNPLLDQAALPRFASITAAHIEPAMDALLAKLKN